MTALQIQKERKSTMSETRQFAAQFEAREDKEKGTKTITGRPVVIGAEADLGFCREVIAEGALDKTDLTDVLFFVGHDTAKIPLARSRHNNDNSTMRLKVDAEGMVFEADLDTEGNSEAANLYSAIARQDISGMSFMFDVDGEEWSEETTASPLRTVTSIEAIYEVSAVAFPAYPTTEISLRDKEALESVERSLVSARAARTLENARDSGELLALEKAKIQAKSGGTK
jgi:HK97 family phage prohead protease